MNDLLRVLRRFKELKCGKGGVELTSIISVYRKVDAWLKYQELKKKWDCRDNFVEEYQTVLGALHGALGGEVVWDQDTIWRGGERVAEIWELEESKSLDEGAQGAAIS